MKRKLPACALARGANEPSHLDGYPNFMKKPPPKIRRELFQAGCLSAVNPR
jgi:hypothetical protein